MHLKYLFGHIHADRFDRIHDESSGLPVKISFFHFWRFDAVGP